MARYLVISTPDRIRICDLSFRKAALYPTELLGHQCLLCQTLFGFGLAYPTKKDTSCERHFTLKPTTRAAGTLRRAVRSSAFTGILGGRHMECAYLLL